MKLYKKILLITVVSLLAIGSAGGIFIASMTSFNGPTKQNDVSLKTWMNSIKDETKLNDIIMPGSHDAGTNGMSWLSETQHLDIKDQLNLGTRYFDLRVNKHNDDYVIYHSIINGAKFDPIFEDIKEFIVNNPSETLLLDFQHFKNDSDEYVFHKVKNELKGYLINNDTNKTDLKFIDELILKDARGKCVVFFGDNSKYVDESFIFTRNNDRCTNLNSALDSCYEKDRHTISSEDFINSSLPYYIEKIESKIKKEEAKGIFVLQGQLTDGMFVFGPYHRERGHAKNMSKYLNVLPSQKYFHHINVIMRDFLDENKTSEIIKFNKYKNITK